MRSEIYMRDEIEELFSLAEECREWESLIRRKPTNQRLVGDELGRIFTKLDKIARSLSSKEQ